VSDKPLYSRDNNGALHVDAERLIKSPGFRNQVAAAARYVDWYGKGRAQNWRTPRALFDTLHAEYGFTLDGASEAGNGLLPLASTADAPIDWCGHRVFCNPPWSNIAPFIERAARADLAVLLVPARTNVAWFHRALALGAEPRFFAGRPKFELPGHTGSGHNSPVDCMLLVFRSVATGACAA
jgi:hypothetical protein